MNKEIEYYVKSVYGNTNYYIRNSEIANAVMTLTRKKTIDRADMRALETLGFTFKQVFAP